MMNLIEHLLALGAILLLLCFLVHAVQILTYVLSDKPVIEDRLRRYAKSSES